MQGWVNVEYWDHGWPCSCSCYGKAVDQLLLLTCCSVHLQLTWPLRLLHMALHQTAQGRLWTPCFVKPKHTSTCSFYQNSVENAFVVHKIKQGLTEHISLISYCSHLTFYQLLLFLEITSATSHLLLACIRILLLVSRHLPCKSTLLTKSLTFTKVMGLNLHVGLRFQQSGPLHVGLFARLVWGEKKEQTAC